jgi:Mn-dependent DtxR family transcriptional regulator
MTQNDLADFFGVARPSVARAIRDLKDDGYLKSAGKKISILNKKGLGDLIAD